jgi:hypothetical protein
MKAILKNTVRLAVAALPALLQGCGTLAVPPVMMISMASTIMGGVANGALMGGSTVGVIRNAAVGERASDEPAVPIAQAKPVATVAVAKNSTMPNFANGLERACYFPNASGRGLPCT